MNYGHLVTRPFEIVARRPYLWLLGLLAGGAASPNLSGTGARQPVSSARSGGAGWAEVQTFWNEYWGLLLVGAAVLLLLAVVVFVLGCIATGGIIHAAVEHDEGRPYSLRAAWRAGYSTAWRIAGLRLLTFLLAIAPGLLIGALAVATVASASTAAPAAVAFGLAAGALLLAAIVFWLALSLAYQLAQRLIVLESSSVAASLSTGFRMTRRHLKEVGLGWLLLIALSIAAGIGAAIVAVLALIPAGLLGFSGWALAGWVGAVVAGSFAGVFFLGILLAAAGAVAAYTNVYWTLLFRSVRALPEPSPRGAVIAAG